MTAPLTPTPNSGRAGNSPGVREPLPGEHVAVRHTDGSYLRLEWVGRTAIGRHPEVRPLPGAPRMAPLSIALWADYGDEAGWVFPEDVPPGRWATDRVAADRVAAEAGV